MASSWREETTKAWRSKSEKGGPTTGKGETARRKARSSRKIISIFPYHSPCRIYTFSFTFPVPTLGYIGRNKLVRAGSPFPTTRRVRKIERPCWFTTSCKAKRSVSNRSFRVKRVVARLFGARIAVPRCAASRRPGSAKPLLNKGTTSKHAPQSQRVHAWWRLNGHRAAKWTCIFKVRATAHRGVATATNWRRWFTVPRFKGNSAGPCTSRCASNAVKRETRPPWTVTNGAPVTRNRCNCRTTKLLLWILRVLQRFFIAKELSVFSFSFFLLFCVRFKVTSTSRSLATRHSRALLVFYSADSCPSKRSCWWPTI